MSQNNNLKFKEKIKLCKLLVLDFDGVLTDNKVYTDSEGKEMVRCDKYDSTGISALKKIGFPVIILSRDRGGVVGARAKKMRLQYVQGLEEKISVLEKIVKERGITLENVCYIGNDINDLDCLEAVGSAVAVANSHPDILDSVDFITSKPGGHGAVREICDMLIEINHPVRGITSK